MALTAVVMLSTTMRNFRLSKMSASAPAGIAKRQIGRLLAACTSATIKGSGLRLVISQPDAALYIQPPTLDTSVAVQIMAKDGWRNGATNDGGRSGVVSGDRLGPLRRAVTAPCYKNCAAAGKPAHQKVTGRPSPGGPSALPGTIADFREC